MESSATWQNIDGVKVNPAMLQGALKVRPRTVKEAGSHWPKLYPHVAEPEIFSVSCITGIEWLNPASK
jgi:hypothetical protein